MAVIEKANEKLHKIKVKLYPNYLPAIKGKYLARTDNESSLSIEEVCTCLKNRGGFTGNYATLIENVKQYFDEAAYQLCDGFSINTGYFSIQPNIGGTFDSPKETYDENKNPVNFKYRTRLPLRNLAKHINVDITGVADNTGWIDEFTDTDEKVVNSIYIENHIFKVTGSRIKIEGDDPTCGIYFVPVEDPTKAVKVVRIPENTNDKIIGVCVKTGYMHNRIQIITQFSNNKIPLKTPRVITSGFMLEEV